MFSQGLRIRVNLHHHSLLMLRTVERIGNVIQAAQCWEEVGWGYDGPIPSLAA